MTRERIVFFILILLVALAVLLTRPGLLGAADPFTICRDSSPDYGLRFLVSPGSEIYQYDFSPKPQVGGGFSPDYKYLIVDGVWTGPTGIQLNGVWHYVNWDTAFCNFTYFPETWRPGAPTILMEWKDITTDCALIDIDNHDGGWSRVESKGVPVLLHYGQNLIGGHHQSLETKDYRLVESACYE